MNHAIAGVVPRILSLRDDTHRSNGVQGLNSTAVKAELCGMLKIEGWNLDEISDRFLIEKNGEYVYLHEDGHLREDLPKGVSMTVHD